MTTTWTSPSAGQCRSGPAPLSKPRDSSRNLPALSGCTTGGVSGEKPPRLPRGSSADCDSVRLARPTRARCIRCCKLRASRVPIERCDRRFRPGFLPSTAHQQTPTSPETLGAPSSLSVCNIPGAASRRTSRGEPTRLNGALAGCASRATPECPCGSPASMPFVALPCFSGGPPLRRGESARAVPPRGDRQRDTGADRSNSRETGS